MPPKPRNSQIKFYPALFLSLLMLISFVSCGKSPYQEVEEAVLSRQRAMNAKNLEAYMSVISIKYSDGKKTYKDIKSEAEKNFSAFDKIEYNSQKRGIYLENDQAVAVEEYVLSFWIADKKHSLKNKERLVLRKEDGGWKIVKGL